MGDRLELGLADAVVDDAHDLVGLADALPEAAGDVVALEQEDIGALRK
jgi:hypothetical protein